MRRADNTDKFRLSTVKRTLADMAFCSLLAHRGHGRVFPSAGLRRYDASSLASGATNETARVRSASCRCHSDAPVCGAWADVGLLSGSSYYTDCSLRTWRRQRCAGARSCRTHGQVAGPARRDRVRSPRPHPMATPLGSEAQAHSPSIRHFIQMLATIRAGISPRSA